MLDIIDLSFLQKVCQSVVRCKRRCTSGESRSRWHRSVHLLSSLARMRLGKPRPARSWIWQGMWTATRKTLQVHEQQREDQGRCECTAHQRRRAGDKWHGKGWGTQCFLCLDLYQLKESFRNPRSPRPDRGKVWNKEVLHWVKEEKVRALKQTGFTRSFASSPG